MKAKLKSATILDVAREAGVSAATVSRTFRNPKSISQETYQRVVDTANRMNYEPMVQRTYKQLALNGVQNHLVNQFAIGCLYISSTNSKSFDYRDIPLQMLKGMQLESSKCDHIFKLYFGNKDNFENYQLNNPKAGRKQDLPNKADYIESFCIDPTLDGLILAGAVSNDLLSEVSDIYNNIILLNMVDVKKKQPSLLFDDFNGFYDAVNYLISLGHKRIAICRYDDLDYLSRDKIFGYKCAMDDAGLQRLPEINVQPEKLNDIGFLNTVLTHHPTAIITTDTRLACKIVEVCNQSAVSIPRDLSLISYDNQDIGDIVHPDITTITTDNELMGRNAIRTLSGMIDDQDSYVYKSLIIKLPVSIKHKNTCSNINN